MKKITYRDITKLAIYNKAYTLSVKVYNIIKGSSEREFRSQLLRCVTSVHINLSEGYVMCDIYKSKWLQFIMIAYGSLNETKSWVHFFKEIGLISHIDADNLIKDINELNYMFVALINRVRQDIEDLQSSKKVVKQCVTSTPVVLDLLEEVIDIPEPNDDYDDFCEQYGF